MPKTLALAACAVLAALAACSSPSNRLDRMYASLKADIAEHGHETEFDPSLAERHAERAGRVREMVAAGEVTKGMDRFHASVILVETEDLENLKLAEQLALQSADQGVELGRRVAAEAIDKQLVKQGLPQRYGTQYEWVVVLRAWRLYPIDPRTTDADRRAMGVPSLAEIRAGEDKLNAVSRAR
jgi:hypothetical protein